MKRLFQNILISYFNSKWKPSGVYLIFLLALIILDFINLKVSDLCSAIFWWLMGVSFLGILVASIWNLIKKRWATGLANFILVPVCLIITLVVMAALTFSSIFGPSDDGFADNLTIPQGIEITNPLEKLATKPGSEDDIYQFSLLTALASHGNHDSTITAHVTSLQKLNNYNPEVLRWHLAASPAWRVFKERERLYATRRWMIGDHWKYDLHGYYSRSDIDRWSSGEESFQSRFTIGLDGKLWARGDVEKLDAGETSKLDISKGNGIDESHCVIDVGKIVVEIFEQSNTRERRLTKAGLNHLEKELRPLAASPTLQSIRDNLPPGSIKTGPPSFQIRKSFQPGIYDSEIWVNPGEFGMIYLKAFEITQGTELSVSRLKDKSNEWIGWSHQPDELFFSNTHFTIYEGDWGSPYAARFEVWFQPDSGGADRRLIEKNFKIEGWQR